MNRIVRNRFEIVAEWFSENLGSPYAFTAALAVVLLWGSTGPLFGFSDTWQLVINTGTTIATFLMVFLVQNTQNRLQRAQQNTILELSAQITRMEAHIAILIERQTAVLEETVEAAVEEAMHDEELRDAA